MANYNAWICKLYENCVGACMSIHARDSVSLPGFCANGGFGNHLTSVTSCYVSPTLRDRGDRGGEGNDHSVRRIDGERRPGSCCTGSN